MSNMMEQLNENLFMEIMDYVPFTSWHDVQKCQRNILKTYTENEFKRLVKETYIEEFIKEHFRVLISNAIYKKDIDDLYSLINFHLNDIITIHFHIAGPVPCEKVDDMMLYHRKLERDLTSYLWKQFKIMKQHHEVMLHVFFGF
jgi:hypothetical protein